MIALKKEALDNDIEEVIKKVKLEKKLKEIFSIPITLINKENN